MNSQDIAVTNRHEIIRTSPSSVETVTGRLLSMNEPRLAELDAHVLTAGVPEPVLLTNAAGVITDHNRAAATFFSDRERLTGQHIDSLLPGGARGSGQALRRQWRSQVDVPNGERRELQVDRAPLRRSGHTIGHVYVAHDVTQLVELNWWREQLLYHIAHDVEGALSVLEGVIRVWGTRNPGAGATETVQLQEIGVNAVGRVRRLLQDVLAAGSLRAGYFHVAPRAISAVQLIEEARRMVQPELDLRGQRVVVEVPSPEPWIQADEIHAGRVLVNLLTNAAKYGPQDSVIELSLLAPNEGQVQFAVTDHGPGIPQEQQQRLFERFYRVRSGESSGVGLGLAIAKGIVEAHGGHIGLDSEPGRGTRVWFTLPAATEAPAA
jgi:two-component system phosphate regulon sensor histidine kinase PhoR